MARLAHGSALVVACLTLLVMAATSSANMISTVAGGGTQDPPHYDEYNDPPGPGGYIYADPLEVELPNPTGIAWSGDPKGLFYLMPGGSQCVQLWVDPDPTTAEYGLAIEGGTLGSCNPLTTGYYPAPGNPFTAKQVLLKDPCCVASDWRWDRAADTTGPFVASTDSGHVQFYSWKLNTAFTVGGTTPPDCGTVGLAPASGSVTAAGFCNVNALARQTFNVLGDDWWAFGEQNRGSNPTVLNWVDSTDTVQGIAFNPASPSHPSGIAALVWDHLVGISVSDGSSAIHRLQRSGSTWNLYILAGAKGQPGFAGDGGAPASARFNDPNGLAVGFDGALYIADTGNCRIRKLSKIVLTDQQNETVTTVAGNGCNPNAPLGDGGLATSANLDHPVGVAMASTGLLITDTGHKLVRLVDRTSIVGAPAATSDTTPAFDIRSLDTPSNIECELNDAPVTCASIGPLADGAYKLEAWEAGTPGDYADPADPTPAVANFVVDTAAPTGVALGTPAADASGIPGDGDFTWSAGDGGHAGIASYELWIDGAKNRDVAPSACNAGTCSSKATAALAEGAHTWQVRSVDGAGNAAATDTRTFNVGNPPTAAFTISPNPVLAGRAATFDASTSSDESGIARYEWDLDGDGAFEQDGGSSPTASSLYQVPTTITVSLRVTDGAGKQSTVSQVLRVTTAAGAQNLLGISINSGAQYTRTTNVKLLVKAPSRASAVLVSNDGGFLAPRTLPVSSSIDWKLESSGPERLPKTVYVRFMLGPIISETYTDDIILDEKPPIVQQASLLGARLPGSNAAAAAAAKRYKVRVRARDSNSGVSGIQVTANKRKPGKLLRYKRVLSVRSAKRPRFVRARDRAGNFSRWKKLR